MTYQRNRKLASEEARSASQNHSNPLNNQQLKRDEPQDPKSIRINGRQQVLELLMAADPAFRESLLRKIATQDRPLADALRRQLSQK